MSALLRCAVAALMLCSALSQAAAPPPSVRIPRGQLIDGLGLVEPQAMALWRDGFGRPQVLYVDRTRVRHNQLSPAPLLRAGFTGWSWTREQIALLETVGAAAGEPSGIELVARQSPLDGSLHVLVTEQRGSIRHLRYLRQGGSGAALDEVLHTGSFRDPRLAVDAQGQAYAAWLTGGAGASPGSVQLARRAGGQWTMVTAVHNVAREPALATHPNAAGAELGWVEHGPNGMQGASVLSVPASGALGAPEIVFAPEINHAVHDLALAGGPGTQLEAVLVQSHDGNGWQVQHRTRGSGSWPCFGVQPGCRIYTSVEQPVLPAQAFQREGEHRVLALGGADPQLLWLPAAAPVWNAVGVGGQQLAAVAVAGSSGLPMALSPGTFADDHRDLHWLAVAEQWVARRVPDDSNTLVRGALALSNDATGNPLLLARFDPSGSDVRLLRWDTAGNDFVQQMLPAVGVLAAASLAPVAEDGIVHAAVVSDQGLLHVAQTAGQFTVTPVLAGVAVASDPTMLRAPDGRPVIVYLDAQRRPRIAARSAAGSWQFESMGETSVPVTGGLHAAMAAEGFLVHATFHADQRLQHARRGGDFTAGGSTLALAPLPHGFPASVVGEAHALTVLADGGIAVAFSARSLQTQASRLGFLAFASDGQNVGGDLGPATLTGPITALALTVGQGSGLDPRVLWAQHATPAASSPPQLLYAQGRLVGPTQEDFGALQVAAGVRPQLGLGGEGRVQVAWVDSSELWLARRQPALPLAGDPLPAEFTGRSQALPGSQSLAYCICLLREFLDPLVCDPLLPALPAHASRGMPGSDPLIGRLRQQFASTAAGRYYLALWTTHADEITAMTLSQPGMLSQRWRTWADLRPGLEALVDGRGDEVPFSADLVRSARAVWLGWAGPQASDELRAAVEAELQRLGDFESFVGLGFEQWFNQLSPGAPLDRLLADGFEE